MTRRPTRAEVPVEHTWNLDDLFRSTAQWEAELAAVEAEIPGVSAHSGSLGEGAASLLACLDAQEALYIRFLRVDTYARLRSAEDGTSAANQAASARAGALGARIGAELSFIRSEILQLPDGTIARYLAEEPGLTPYRQYLEQLLELKPHQLAPDTEAALASLGEVLGSPYLVYSRATTADIEFEPVRDGQGREVPNSFSLYEFQYEFGGDTVLRRNGFASFVKGLTKHQNSLAATFATEVKKNVVLARLRRYESTTHMLLQPHRIPPEVYHNVLDVIQADLAPHMRRMARLRKRVLGLDKVYFCDTKAPLDPAYEPATTFEEASDLILEALSVLGPEYGRIMRNALKERWVDRVDNIGKSGGAFCSSPYGVHSFILMTWTDAMRSAFILAHELGHAGHFNLAMRNQRYMNTRPSMFFVEAPSTINELLLGNHILARSNDPRMRRWVILQMLGTFHHNFVTHLLEGELQRRIYGLAEAGRPITASMLNETKGDILTQFWGDTVEIDDGARITWIRQPHYYMGLYPYTYAAGLSAAVAAEQLIRSEGQPAVDRWLSALKAGGSLKPMELMQLAGVDMTKPDPIRSAVAFVGSLVDQLEESFE